jgi:hypothetical protein
MMISAFEGKTWDFAVDTVGCGGVCHVGAVGFVLGSPDRTVMSFTTSWMKSNTLGHSR